MSAASSPNEDRRYRPDRDGEIVRAWELHRSGATMRQIAAALDCSVATAHTRVKEAREVLMVGEALNVEHARARSAASLDHWQSILEAGITTGEHTPLQAVPVLLKIDERRARLLGLDAAMRVRVERATPEPDRGRVSDGLLQELTAVTVHEQRHSERHDDPATPCSHDDCELLAQARTEVAAQWAAASPDDPSGIPA